MPFNKEGKKESIKDVYINTLFLKYIESNKSESRILKKKFLDEKLEINPKILLNQLLKKGYLSRKKDISIASTSKGRKLVVEGIICLTDKGQKYLSDRKDLISFFEFASPYVSIAEYQAMKKRMKEGWTFEKVMIYILVKKLNSFKSSSDYISVRNISSDLGYLYSQIGDKTRAIYNYMTALYFDISGIEYYRKFKAYIKGNITEKELRMSYEGMYIEPYIISCIRAMGTGYRSDMPDHIYKENKINMNLCTRNRFEGLVYDIMGDKFSYRGWEEYFRKAFDRMILVAEKYRKG